MAGPTTHSALGASSAERWLNCPGSARVNATLPEQPESVYAREGTRAHALAQHCLEGGYASTKPLIHKPVPGLDDDLTPVTEDMAEAVQIYLDTVYSALKAAGPKAKLYVEQKFKLPFMGPDLDGSVPGGTNDTCIFLPDAKVPMAGAIDLYDYKHGAGKFVSVKDNKQLKYYAHGAVEWFKKLGVKITAVRVSIVQPRCDYVENKVRTVSVSLSELADFKEDLIAGAYEARQPGAKCNAGPWCKGTWCKGALQVACETFKEAATAGIIQPAKPKGADIFSAIDLTPTTIDPTTLSPDELGKRLQQAEMLEDYLSCLKAHALSEAAAGRMPTDFKWVESGSNRIWSLSESEVLKSLQAFGNGVEFAPRKLLSVAQAEKEIGKARFQKSEAYKTLVTKPKGKPVLAHVSDDRPATSGPVKE